MMSVNNNNMDLTLGLGYSDHKLNNDSGAGVNADSGLHIFGSPDPLSELVWTPKKGLSLKRADNSLAKKKPFLLWIVAPKMEGYWECDLLFRYACFQVEKVDEIYHDELYKSRGWYFPGHDFTLLVVWSPYLAKANIFEDDNGLSTDIVQLHLNKLDKGSQVIY